MGILKDVEVFVKVNGDKLEEHIDHDDAGESTDCMVRYVEAKDGAEFEIGFVSLVPFDITYHGSHSYQGLCFALSVDGQKVRSTVVHGTRLSGTARGVELRENRGWILKPFKFAQIVTTEERSSSQTQALKETVANLGKIEVEVFRVNKVTDTHSSWGGPNVKSLQPVPEKALKGQALSHGTSLGKSENIAQPNYVSCQYVDPASKPYLTFEFRYRSRKALQNMFIIPRSPSPAPLAPLEDRPPESLTREELLELVNRRLPAIKNEIKAKSGETAGNVKRERDEEYREVLSSARPSKVNRGQQKIEVIDLLDD